MANYGPKSLEKLMTCDARLVRLFRKIIDFGYDNTILEGHRDEVAQHAAFVAGNSQVDWPNGKHNAIPSSAVDATPFLDGSAIMPESMNGLLRRFKDGTATMAEVHKMIDGYRQLSHFAGYAQGVAQCLGMKVRWGGDWNENFSVFDNDFDDLFHFELKE